MGHRIVVCDSGPIIHLSEIGRIECMNLFSLVYVPSQIYKEIKAIKGPGFKEIEREIFKVIEVQKKDQKLIDIFADQFILSHADASVLAIAHRMGADAVFTDDLDLRDAVKMRKMIPVGTVGILLRSYTEGVLSKRQLNSALDDLLEHSSLYITKGLIDQVKEAIKTKSPLNK